MSLVDVYSIINKTYPFPSGLGWFYGSEGGDHPDESVHRIDGFHTTMAIIQFVWCTFTGLQ